MGPYLQALPGSANQGRLASLTLTLEGRRLKGPSQRG